MSTLNLIIEDNISALRQAAASIAKIADNIYKKPGENFFKSSVGCHFRHIIEHYTEFFKGLDSLRIDYDNRQRITEIEQNKQVAIASIEQIIDELQRLKDNEDASVSIHSSSSVASETSFIASNLSRELLFLHSHLVHHFALIDIILKFFRVNVMTDLGIAPSTQKYLSKINTTSAVI